MRATACVLSMLIACGISAAYLVADANEINDARRLVRHGGMPPGYRDWPVISVAREEGALNDIRAVLGNSSAMRAFKSGQRTFPDGTIIARLAWSYDSSAENNRVFGRHQSSVAGTPKNGVQFMMKDSKRYASTGGWRFAQFESGLPVDDSVLTPCASCHQAVATRDFVFTRYAP